MGDVQFPAQKVNWMEEHARHFGKVQMPYFYPTARTVNVMFDGSIKTLTCQNINDGYYWTSGGTFAAMAMTYDPDPVLGDPPWPDASTQTRNGKHRWTAGFLKGIDVGGKIPFQVP
jgi:hypothetical protein